MRCGVSARSSVSSPPALWLRFLGDNVGFTRYDPCRLVYTEETGKRHANLFENLRCQNACVSPPCRDPPRLPSTRCHAVTVHRPRTAIPVPNLVSSATARHTPGSWAAAAAAAPLQTAPAARTPAAGCRLPPAASHLLNPVKQPAPGSALPAPGPAPARTRTTHAAPAAPLRGPLAAGSSLAAAVAAAAAAPAAVKRTAAAAAAAAKHTGTAAGGRAAAQRTARHTPAAQHSAAAAGMPPRVAAAAPARPAAPMAVALQGQKQYTA